jgi:hypothetical protein
MQESDVQQNEHSPGRIVSARDWVSKWHITPAGDNPRPMRGIDRLHANILPERAQ